MAINYFQQLGLDSFNPGQALAQGQAYRMNEFELNAAKQREQQMQQAQQQQALKFANDQQKKLAAQAAGMFYNSLQSGDIEGAKQVAARYQNEINSLGDPSFTVDRVNMMLETPEGLEQLKQASLGIVQLAAGPDAYATYTRAQMPSAQAQQQKPAGLIEYEAFQQMTPQQQAEYIKLKRGEKMSAEEQLNLERDKADIGVSTEQKKTERKQGVTDLSAINQQRKGASSIKANMEQLAKLSEKAFDGSFAGSKVFLSRLAGQIGIDIEGLPESEVFTAIANDAVLGKSQQMSGALSNADMEFLRQAAPTLQQTAAGRKKLIEYAVALADREIDYARKANEFRARKGYFDLGEFQEFYDAESKPLFGGASDQQQANKAQPVNDNRSDEEILAEYIGAN